MKKGLPETDAERKMLQLLRDVYGYDVLSFRFAGSEMVEVMSMAYKCGKEDAAKESK